MKRLFLGILPALSLALVILSLSVMRASAIEYEFAPVTHSTTTLRTQSIVNYDLPPVGRISPASSIWPIKAAWDRVGVYVHKVSRNEPQYLLSLADDRLVRARREFEEGNPEIGLSVLTKAEKYLQLAALKERDARQYNRSDSEFLYSLSLATLKHSETIDYIASIAPEDARAYVVKVGDYPKELYGIIKTDLYAQGISDSNIPQQ